MKYEKPQIILHNTATTAIRITAKDGNPYENLVNQILTALAYEADE